MDLFTVKIVVFLFLSITAIFFGSWLTSIGFANGTNEDAITIKETTGNFRYNFLMLIREIMIALLGVLFILAGIYGIDLIATILKKNF